MVRADGTTRAVLFDVFGTLVDYQPDRRRLRYPSTCDLLRRRGHEMSAGAFVERWDAASTGLERASAATLEEFSMLDAATAFAAENDLPLSEAECRELAATFLAEWQIHLVPVGGAADLLVRLAHHVTIGVVSNTHDADMVPAILRSMGVAHLVAVVVLSVDVGHRKPHPAIYRVAVDRLGMPASQIAFVGDSFDADYVGPTAAGMTAYLIDPVRRHDVPDPFRLDSILDIDARLR